MTARLTEMLFIEILRQQITAKREDGGWLAALGDRHLSRALSALHHRPAYPWTVRDLARHSGLSRSTLVERFVRVLDTSPMRYLAMWRLQLAAQALQNTDRSLTEIAWDIGYGSEEGFSRAFKRGTVVAPGSWRRARRRRAETTGVSSPSPDRSDGFALAGDEDRQSVRWTWTLQRNRSALSSQKEKLRVG